MRRISALIVDDEPLGRESVRELVAAEKDIQVVGECADGLEAIEQIHLKNPDLVFLDIQMPELNGFDVLTHLDREKLPAIVFVTAYDEFAVKAFEVRALDYLLKPIDPDRFSAAIERARESIAAKDPAAGRLLRRQIGQLLNDVSGSRAYREIVAVRTFKKISIVRVNDINWIQAQGDYLYLHSGGKRHLLHESLASLEKQLDPSKFIRIHRSIIVNLDRIGEIVRSAEGDYIAILPNDVKLPIGRLYRPKLLSLLRV
jgi:two-component system LytT family response regulator